MRTHRERERGKRTHGEREREGGSKKAKKTGDTTHNNGKKRRRVKEERQQKQEFEREGSSSLACMRKARGTKQEEIISLTCLNVDVCVRSQDTSSLLLYKVLHRHDAPYRQVGHTTLFDVSADVS